MRKDRLQDDQMNKVEFGLPLGLWLRVRARIRQAGAWEMPAGAGVMDDRMVECWPNTESDLHVLDVTEVYTPSSDLNLLGTFIHVFAGERTPTDEEVADFYGEHGPLLDSVTVDGQSVAAWTLRLEEEDQRRLSEEARRGLCEPLWWVRERALEVRLTYDLYVALKEDKVSSLRALLGGVPEGKRILSMYMLAGSIMRDLVSEQEVGRGDNLSTHEGVVRRPAGSFALDFLAVGTEPTQSPLRPLTEDECRHWARSLLAGQLNAAERRTRREWTPIDDFLPQASAKGEPAGAGPSGGLGLVWGCRFDSLTTAIYLQIAHLAQRNIALRQCLGCQRLFYSRRRNHRYCDAYCGDAARQRNYYDEHVRKAKGRLNRRRRSAKTKG